MRLGDLDALIRTHKSEVATIGKDWTVDDLATAIETAPTIDAIPVEYLMKYAQLPTEFAIAAWRKQDKNAQEKQIKRLDKPMSFDDALNLVNEVFPLGQKEQEAQDG